MTNTAQAAPPAQQSRSSGLEPLTLVLVVVSVVVIGVLVVIYTLTTGSGPAAPADLPALTGKGLQYAHVEAKAAGWSNLKDHDAFGQDRAIRDRRDWRVCFQTPAAGPKPALSQVQLAAVKINEQCPAVDMGTITPVYGPNGTNIVPNLTDYTPFIARKAFGEDASLRVQRLDEKDKGPLDVFAPLQGEVSDTSGDWRICRQAPLAGDAWDGQVVVLEVVPVEQKC